MLILTVFTVKSESAVPEDGRISDERETSPKSNQITSRPGRVRMSSTNRIRISLSRRRSRPRQLKVENITKPFKCQVSGCDYSGAKNHHLKMHMQRHQKDKFACTACSSKFNDQKLLDEHIHEQHGDQFLKNDKKIQPKDKQILSEKKQDKVQKSKLYTCEKCPKKFKIRGNLISHQQICTSEFLP